MDVRMPDGTVVKNIPDGTTKAQIQAKLGGKYGLPAAEAPAAEGMPGPRTQPPEWAKNHPDIYQAALAANKVVGPVVEMGGLVGGGILGSAVGPEGTVGGAALGYAAGKEVSSAANRALGLEAPRTPTQMVTQPAGNVAEGASLEMGGQIAGPVLAKAIQLGVKPTGAVMDWLNGLTTAEKRAASMSREAVAQSPGAAEALKTAPPGATASEALASQINPVTKQAVVNAPVAQALLQRAEAHAPQQFTDIVRAQNEQALNQLASQAGGISQTNALAAQQATKQALNQATTPMREQALGSANIAGELAPKLKAEVDRFANAATSKVEDVRKYTAAGERARQRAIDEVTAKDMPAAMGEYTHMGELADLSEKVAQQAADASLDFGMAARFKQYALDSLKAHGLQPLTGDSIIAQINRKMADPSIAGNDPIRLGLQNVVKDIQQWTKADGVIDAQALDAIRKNSANSVALQLLGAAGGKSQKELAGKIMQSVGPMITDAIEAAGGTGYRDYLNTWQLGMRGIEKSKMGAKLLDTYRKNPKKFAEIVEGDAPKAVEKIFGPGKTDLKEQVGADTFGRLQSIAKSVRTAESASTQAKAGHDALVDLMEKNKRLFRMPHFINAKAAIANQVLDQMEHKVGKATMDKLATAAKSAKSFDELINTFPAAERMKINKALDSIRTAKGFGGAAAGINALATQPSQNALAGP